MPAAPPGRGGRQPGTRLRFVHSQLARSTFGGDPLVGIAARPTTGAIRVVFEGASRFARAGAVPSTEHVDTAEPLRAIKRRLVEAAEQGHRRLRITSAASLAHPQAASLLRECTRLDFEAVEVAGEASAAAEWSDRDRRALRGLARFDAAIFSPDREIHDAHVGRDGAFDAAAVALHRLHMLAKVPVGTYAVVHNADQIAPFAAAWTEGTLVGTPEFRLAPTGESLDALAEAGAALPAGPARRAIAAVVPPCLLARTEDVVPAEAAGWAWGRPQRAGYAPSAIDRLGTYETCAEAGGCPVAALCPGIATGWSSSRIVAVVEEPSPRGAQPSLGVPS